MSTPFVWDYKTFESIDNPALVRMSKFISSDTQSDIFDELLASKALSKEMKRLIKLAKENSSELVKINLDYKS